MRLSNSQVREIRSWLGLTQAGLAAEMNLTTQAIKRYEKSGVGGAAARLLEILAGQPAKGRPGRKPKTARSRFRPHYKSIKPEDWGAAHGYDICEPKLDGHYAELSGGPNGWILRSRGGHEVASGPQSLPRCLLLVENLGFETTQWARGEAPGSIAGKWVAWAAVDQTGCHASRTVLIDLVSRLESAGLPVVVVEQFHIYEAMDLWEHYVIGAGFEGLVFKSADGARFAKMKPRFSWDYVCIEVDGGSVIGGVYTQHGALIKDATRCRLPKTVQIKPGDVFEVSGLKVSDRGTMRSPKFERLRPDKPAAECLTPIATRKM